MSNQRFEKQRQFLQNRLSPEGYAGLHLTIGVLVVLLAGWGFGAIAEDLSPDNPLGAVRSARGGLVSPARDDDAYPCREGDHVFRLNVGINNPLSGCRTRLHRLSSLVQFVSVRGHDDRRELAQCSAQASFPSSPPRAGKSACHSDGLRISEWPYHGRNRAFRLARVIPSENREHYRGSVRLFHRGGARYPADGFNASLSWRTFS